MDTNKTSFVRLAKGVEEIESIHSIDYLGVNIYYRPPIWSIVLYYLGVKYFVKRYWKKLADYNKIYGLAPTSEWEKKPSTKDTYWVYKKNRA